jgi:HEAT repeat protein
MNVLSIRLQSIVAGFVVSATAAATCVAADTAASLKAAAGGSGDARYAAIDDLGEHHVAAAQVVPELQKLLTDKDPQVRWRSARALGDYGDQAQAAAPALRDLLEDSDAIVKYHAAVALGRVGDQSEATVEALVAAAASGDERVARAAIAALDELQPDRQHVVKALGAVLSSDDEAVMLRALEAIVERGAKAAPMLNEALKNPKTTYLACTAIERIGPEAKETVPALTEVIGSTKHSHLLIQALLAAASIGPDAKSAAPKIVPLLEVKEDATVPVAAAYALGSIGAQDATEALRGAMKKDNEFLQMVSAWAVAKLNPGDEAAEKTAVDKLVAGLKSKDPGIRTAAAKGLQSLQAPPEMVGPALVALINDADEEVQVHAVDAIASLGESVVPRVTNGLKNPQLRHAAIQVLRKLGPKAAGAVQPLMEAASSGDAKLRTEINLALGAIGPAAAPATEMLAKSLESSDAGERESALYALRQIGPKADAAARPLLRKLQADDSFEAMAAAWALARIAPANDQVAVVVVQKLAGGLSNKDETVRLESAMALGDMGPKAKDAAEAVDKAAKTDSSAAVRAAAAAALERVKS